jgi:carbamoyltransferase
VNEDEYKVMGLAGYGRSTMVDEVRRLIRRTPDGAFTLDLDYFEFHTTSERSYSSRFVELFGPPRNSYEPIDLKTGEGQRFANCAASVQRVLEDTLVEMARALHQETGLPDLCLGGGVALNGVANARILAESGFERVFVPPAPGDAGCALGAALYADRIHGGNPDRAVPDHPFWGPSVDGRELARLAGGDGQLVDELDDCTLIDRIAADLVDGRVVGWMEGALEFGPRALGHRSILAAPHAAEMRDRLNRDIKYREEFRPFAPVVPIEAAARYFDLPAGGTRLARFMSGVFPVRPEWRARLEAITHIDGTSRLQVLERAMAPRLYALLEAYERRSGMPVLLNTSFNLSGEPIVNRVAEGYSTFLRCGIDVLVAGQTRVMKHASPLAKPREEAACSGSLAGFDVV